MFQRRVAKRDVLRQTTRSSVTTECCVLHLGLSAGPDFELVVDTPHSHFPSLVTLCAQNFVPSAPVNVQKWVISVDQLCLIIVSEERGETDPQLARDACTLLVKYLQPNHSTVDHTQRSKRSTEMCRMFCSKWYQLSLLPSTRRH